MRRLDALPELVAFTTAALDTTTLAPSQRHTVHFAIEELFTNMLKYSPSGATEIRIEIVGADGGLEVTLIDSDVDLFDVTRAPSVRVDLPLDQREPGGLGLHLVRRLVDDLRYDYVPERRESRIRLRVTAAGPAGSGGGGGPAC